MKFLSSLDARDRRLLVWSMSIALGLAVLIGFLLPNGNANDNPLVSTYLSGQHGARAAYETLVRSGYSIERWERPLGELAAQAGPDTVVIFAEPFSRETEDLKAVRQIVERGGRVLSTGFWGGYLLPGAETDTPREFNFAACKLVPEGLDPLADSGEVWMVPQATWQLGNPAHRTQYSCGGQPAVVEYDFGAGHVVWWASATPLENGSLARAQDLDLLLNSLGPRDGHHFYWDESLHGEMRSTWSYVPGPAIRMLWFGLAALATVIVFSFSRRSGPLRDLPQAARATPIEFLEALGSLYRGAKASSTTVAIALEQFRRQSLRTCGLKQAPMGAEELAEAIRRRFPQVGKSLEADLKACEEAIRDDGIEPRAALKLIQTLHQHQDTIRKAGRPGHAEAPAASNQSTVKQERAS